MTNANPSLNPANNDSLTGVFRHVMNKMVQKMDGVLPARVVAFDRTKNIVQVQPLINLVNTNSESIGRAQIASVPVYQIGGGGFFVNFNILTGDQGLLIACDRDISLYLQSGNQSDPNTMRIKNFSDGFFLPMVIRNFTIDSEDNQNLVIGKSDSTVKISFSNDTIKLKAGNIEIDGDLLVTGDVVLNSDAQIDGDLNVTGEAIVQDRIASNNNITATGTITPGVPP